MNFYEKITNLLHKNKSVIMYLFFGVLTTILNIIIYKVFSDFFKVEYLISNIIAWFLSVLFAYITNKIYVFESKNLSKKKLIIELFNFFYYRILSLVIEIIILYVAVSILKIDDFIVKIFTNILIIILNYIFSKFLIFKK